MRAEATDIRTNRMADEPELHCFMSGVPHLMYVQFGFQIVQTPGQRGDGLGIHECLSHHPHRWAAAYPVRRSSCFKAIRSADGRATRLSSTQRTRTTGPGSIRPAISIPTPSMWSNGFTLADANTIRYEATIEDPKAYTQTVEGRRNLPAHRGARITSSTSSRASKATATSQHYHRAGRRQSEGAATTRQVIGCEYGRYPGSS